MHNRLHIPMITTWGVLCSRLTTKSACALRFCSSIPCLSVSGSVHIGMSVLDSRVASMPYNATLQAEVNCARGHAASIS